MTLSIVYGFAQGQAAGSSNRMEENISADFIGIRVSANAVHLCTKVPKVHFLGGPFCGAGSNHWEKSGVENLELTGRFVNAHRNQSPVISYKYAHLMTCFCIAERGILTQ
jgi:hypothetical protein